ncbi:hypothetical protein B566_EDAN018570 [Ephemera danica]|nr:hypothetical protein B566_EDAN018570 [Ephemera danica]
MFAESTPIHQSRSRWGTNCQGASDIATRRRLQHFCAAHPRSLPYYNTPAALCSRTYSVLHTSRVAPRSIQAGKSSSGQLAAGAEMDLSRLPPSTHGHDFHCGLSRVVMVRKTEQRTFVQAKAGATL